MDLARARYIVVEGRSASARPPRAADAHHVQGDLLLEAPEDNPFLPLFYKDMARYALPTQLNFRFQRVDQIRPLSQTDMFGARQLLISCSTRTRCSRGSTCPMTNSRCTNRSIHT